MENTKDNDKTKKQLLEELAVLRQQIAELEERKGERKPAKKQAQQQDTRIQVIYSIAQTVSNTLNLDELLKTSLSDIAGAMQADTGCILLLDESQQMLSLKAQQGMPAENLEQISTLMLNEEEINNLKRWKAPETHLSQIMSENTINKILTACGLEQPDSLITIPLSAQGQTRGSLILDISKKPKLSPDDLAFLQATGSQVSMGIENAALLEKTQELSLTDELTGLYNRRYFYIVLHNEMHRAQRYGPSSSLALLDIDGFRKYNEEYGHTAGDSALKALAQTLLDDLRKTDMAFRYGGDEFAIILQATEAEIAREVVNRTREKWAQVSKSQYTAQESVLGLSAGIVQFPRDADTADGLVLLAETTLQASRVGGGSRSTVASDLGVLHTEVSDTISVDQVYALAATVDARDPFAYGHWERVASVSDIIGKSVGMPEDELSNLHTAALLHDIGKVSIPDSIVTKPDKLTEQEWEVIRRHSAEGARIVSGISSLASIAPLIRHHHESYDGSGYPDGLKGDDIPLGARIINIADAYDTLTTLRPYQQPISHEEACKELKKCAGSQFDPKLVEAFVKAT